MAKGIYNGVKPYIRTAYRPSADGPYTHKKCLIVGLISPTGRPSKYWQAVMADSYAVCYESLLKAVNHGWEDKLKKGYKWGRVLVYPYMTPYESHNTLQS